MSLAITLFGQSPLVNETDKTISLMGSTTYLATKHGLTMEQVLAKRDTMPLVFSKRTGKNEKPSQAAACKELLVAKGVTKEVIAAAYKEYDTNRNAAWAQMRNQNAVLAASPDLKVNLRANKNAKGVVTSVVARYTKASANASKSAQIEQLKAQVKRLLASQAKATVVQATTVTDEVTPF